MKAVKEIVRKYYKYVYTDWEQPVLTSNGIIGGDSFACADKTGSSIAYKCFDGSSTSAWYSAATNTANYIIFYNPLPLIISNIKCYNYTWVTGLWELYGSNDGVTYSLLASGQNTSGGGSFDIDLSSNQQDFKYYRMDSLSIVGGNQRVGWGELSITAKERNVIESTIADYDFYKDIPTYKVIKENDIYKAPHSWEKGQYYGN